MMLEPRPGRSNRRNLMRKAVISMFALVSLAAFTAAPAVMGDLVAVSAHVAFPTANQGGADDGSCIISNSTSGDVRVRLDMSVVFADGKVERLTGIPDPGVIPAGGAFEQDVFFVVPADAALGTARF